jgi:hypothetical protein
VCPSSGCAIEPRVYPLFVVMPEWRNWQTRTTQNHVHCIRCFYQRSPA